MNEPSNQKLLISKGWIQAVALVMLFGFFTMGLLAYYTYTDEPPIPAQVVDANGKVLFTGKDIIAGQQIFLKNGLMEYGSIFGHGAWLGPDFTADYLHRAAEMTTDYYGGSASDTARQQTITDFKTNRYDRATGVLTYSAAQADAFQKMTAYYADFFGTPTTKFGLRPNAITDPEQIRQLTAFFSWSAWAGSALRPHKNYSYTNNWPPESLVGNHASADTMLWSVLSLIALLGGIGLLLAAFGRWNFLGWHGREEQRISFRPPDEVMLTPAQRSCAWFFLVMALLFLMQTLLGGAGEHYRAELSNFFGFDLARVLPFNIARTWHLQLAIFWVATSYLAAGIFLVPMITGREPRGQGVLSYLLLGALAIVVFGSMGGEYAGVFGWIQNGWSWFGNQGFTFLDLGRFWQILLTVGLFFWVVILFRGLRNKLRTEYMGNMPWLFFFAALAIPAFYAVGLLVRNGLHVHHHGFLAVLGRAFVGGGFSRIIHDGHGRLYFRAARRGESARGHAADLSGCDSVFGGRRHRHDAPSVFLRRTRPAHGARRVLLGGGSDSADVPHGRSLELPPTRRATKLTDAHAVPAFLVGDVSGVRRLLEFSRRGRFRFSHQPADCFLL